VEAVILGADGSRVGTPGMMSKADFAPWLMKLIGERALRGGASRGGAGSGVIG
jgi:hypothetical protein